MFILINKCAYELNRIPQQSYYLAWRNMSLQNEYAVIVNSKSITIVAYSVLVACYIPRLLKPHNTFMWGT